MADNREISELIARAVALNLSGSVFVAEHSVDEVRKAYNGVGPQFLPPRLRDFVTKTLGLFEPAAMIHDFRFDQSDGSRAAFDFANREFVENCTKLAYDRYGPLNPKRYRAKAVIRFMEDFNSGDPGWRAWREAYDKNRGTK